jgi:transposase
VFRFARPALTITGVGPQASALFTGLLSRVRFANVNALVAYTGLDPRPNDSGTKVGKRRITKRGHPELRRQLYLCAFAASHSKVFGPMYRSIKARGFKPTEALVILGRKILRIIWSVWKSGQPFDPSRIPAAEPCLKT